METTRLELFFGDEYGEKTKISVDDPSTELVPSEIEQAMNDIITADIFVGKGGKFVTAIGAQIVTVMINEMDF